MSFIDFVLFVQSVFFGYVLLLFSSYAVLFGAAFEPVRRQSKLRKSWLELSDSVEFWPPITVILPAYNEEAVIVDCVRNTLALDYPGLEVVVSCDGSKDNTFGVLVDTFKLVDLDEELRTDFKTKPVVRLMGCPEYPSLRVILKENGGKADALNVGLNAAKTPLVCCCDADTLIERKALRQLVRAFKMDSKVIAASGSLMLTNGAEFKDGNPVSINTPKNWLAATQVLEYMRAFFWGRMGLASFSSMLIVSGAFGLFSRSALANIGGYNHATVGEDMDLIVRLHRYYRSKKLPYKITHSQAAVAWTEAPESLKMLKSQRMRWQRGLCEVLTMHKGMPFERNSGLPGRVGYSYFLFFEALAPIIELFGYLCVTVMMLIGYHYYMVWLGMFCLAMTLSFLVTVSSVFVQQLYFPGITHPREVCKLLSMILLESLVLKPITSYWRVLAMWQFFRGRSAKWDPIARKGFNNTTIAAN